MSNYTKTAEHMYEGEDGIVYDLTEQDDLNDGFGGYLHFKAKRGDTEVEIITNHSGMGLWVEDRRDGYRQVLGTLQYRIPDEDDELCAQLHAMIDQADSGEELYWGEYLRGALGKGKEFYLPDYQQYIVNYLENCNQDPNEWDVEEAAEELYDLLDGADPEEVDDDAFTEILIKNQR